MLLTKIVKTSWNPKTKKWYESKGYIFTKIGDVFDVNTIDLSYGSAIKVDVKCDSCGQITNKNFRKYKQQVDINGKTYCNKCAIKIYGAELRRKSVLNNGHSFEQWCLDNNRQDILDRWDYELNKCSPSEINYGTKVKYYFKCPCGIHKSELRIINVFTQIPEGNFNCNQCNSFGQYLVNHHKEDILIQWSDKNTINPFEISYGNKHKILMNCPNCGNEKHISPNEYLYQGLGCPVCSDGVSYPEKIMYGVLEQLHLEFQTQLTKTTFKWCKGDDYDVKYDFYIPSLNCIIETHGRQHYEISSKKSKYKSLEEIQNNDINKEQLAKNNNIQHYIIIDCRYSEIEFIKNNILNSKLSELVDLSNINWLKCNKYACNSLIKSVCELWNNGLHNTKTIGINLKLDRSTIIRYLKKGAILNWCDYSANKKVYCVELDKVFTSMKEASKITNINYSNISSCCIGFCKSAGKHSITGEKLHWNFL